MGDLTKTCNDQKILSFFFLIVISGTVSTLTFQSAAGQAAESGTIDSISEHNNISTEMKEQLTSSLKHNDKGSNGTIVLLDNEKSHDNVSLFSFENDQNISCGDQFKCLADSTTGWNDTDSLQISIGGGENNHWSSVYGKEIEVKPEERFKVVTHMKLNDWATLSHIALEGSNNSQNWYQFDQCPSGINGPLNWQEFTCNIEIPENATKIRAVLNAGWSTQAERRAVTWFDSANVFKIEPKLMDSNMRAQIVFEDLVHPVSMQFLGPNDFLVVENGGTVKRIINGKPTGPPLLSLDVAYNQGLLGIAVQKNTSLDKENVSKNHTYVFLYYTANEKDGNIKEGKADVSNRLDRYELVGNKLVNATKLLELPAEYDHNGGTLLIGPDKNSLFLTVGDLENESYQVIAHKGLNNATGTPPNGSGGILRTTLDGNAVDSGLLGDQYPLNLYYAYGIRESFGMDFDPITGNLWDTENGANWGDEINLVQPGFNSGWSKVQGIWDRIADGYPNGTGFPDSRNITYHPANLVDFDGNGKYRSPEFTWFHTVGPTALKFLSTDKLGKQYENDMMVADVNNGRIYDFKLNSSRTGLLLNGSLVDKVANDDNELDDIIFAEGFGVITDLKVGFDGYLYVVVFNEGRVYRIMPYEN